jgi:hypothetical protein
LTSVLPDIPSNVAVMVISPGGSQVIRTSGLTNASWRTFGDALMIRDVRGRGARVLTHWQLHGCGLRYRKYGRDALARNGTG